ncbi:cation transporter [Arenimonas sp.]|uniref:cation transporter n=1 Tax=Arenimonas sp. TaxID=1872635 RepID=UPI0035B294EB
MLWTVLAINAGLFFGEFTAGWWADSSALQADSLDALGDAGVYALSLAVVGGSLRQRNGAAVLKGVLQGLFGLLVLAEVVRRLVAGAEPLAPMMAGVAAIALLANLACFLLLMRFRGDDLNMRSVWLCSRNDLASNAGVIAAAGIVALTESPWPDAAVGTLVALLFLHTSWQVLREAWPGWRNAGNNDPQDVNP